MQSVGRGDKASLFAAFASWEAGRQNHGSVSSLSRRDEVRGRRPRPSSDPAINRLITVVPMKHVTAGAPVGVARDMRGLLRDAIPQSARITRRRSEGAGHRGKGSSASPAGIIRDRSDGARPG